MKNLTIFIFTIIFNNIIMGMEEKKKDNNVTKKLSLQALIMDSLIMNPLLSNFSKQQQNALNQIKQLNEESKNIKKTEQKKILNLVHEFNKEFPTNKAFAGFLETKNILIEIDKKTGKEKIPDIDNVCGTLIVYFTKIFLSPDRKQRDENLKIHLMPSKESLSMNNNECSLMNISLIMDLLNINFFESSMMEYSAPSLSDGCRTIIDKNGSCCSGKNHNCCKDFLSKTSEIIIKNFNTLLLLNTVGYDKKENVDDYTSIKESMSYHNLALANINGVLMLIDSLNKDHMITIINDNQDPRNFLFKYWQDYLLQLDKKDRRMYYQFSGITNVKIW